MTCDACGAPTATLVGNAGSIRRCTTCYNATHRRERIATAVLAGLAAWPGDTQGTLTHKDRAGYAITAADALIAELDKPERVKA